MMEFLKNSQFQYANRLIFVKKHQEAEEILFKLASSFCDYEYSLIELRRIELAVYCSKLYFFENFYKNKFIEKKNEIIYYILLTFVKQLLFKITVKDSYLVYNKIILDGHKNSIIYYLLGMSQQSFDLDAAQISFIHSLHIREDFYPSHFALSQIYYRLGEITQGNSHFCRFEELTPYHLYGQNRTHYEVAQFFKKKGRIQEALTAISLLRNWWQKTQPAVPREIMIFELVSKASLLKDVKGREAEYKNLLQRWKQMDI